MRGIVKYKSIDGNSCGIDLDLDCRVRKPLSINFRSATWTNMTLSTQKHSNEESWRALVLVVPQHQPTPKSQSRKILNMLVITCSLPQQRTLKCLHLYSARVTELRTSERWDALLNILKGSRNIVESKTAAYCMVVFVFRPPFFFHYFSHLSRDWFNTATPTLNPEHTSACQLYAHKSSGS